LPPHYPLKRLRLITVCAAVAGSGCSAPPSRPAPQAPTIIPALWARGHLNLPKRVGDSAWLEAGVTIRSNRPYRSVDSARPNPIFGTSDSTVLAVDATGLARALRPGVVVLSATWPGAQATRRLFITPHNVALIFEPVHVDCSPGDRRRIRLLTRDSAGTVWRSQAYASGSPDLGHEVAQLHLVGPGLYDLVCHKPGLVSFQAYLGSEEAYLRVRIVSPPSLRP
jgi:hypothetical protein